MTQPPPGGYPQQGQAPANRPSSHLVLSILVLLFCNLPGLICGIVGIVKGSQVNGLWVQGQYAEAQASSDSAKKWAIWGAIIGLIVIVIYTIIAVSTGMGTDTSS